MERDTRSKAQKKREKDVMIFCFYKMQVNRLATNSATGHCALRSIFHALFISILPLERSQQFQELPVELTQLENEI
jgi:hypothetical protein